jgi:hypothetical protein
LLAGVAAPKSAADINARRIGDKAITVSYGSEKRYSGKVQGEIRVKPKA